MTMQEAVGAMDARELLDALSATSAAAERRAQRPMASVAAAARGGLGRSQLAILRWLTRFECLRISELASRLGCTAQNVSQIVRRLVSAGLVELVTFARRRHWRAARVTERGRRAIGESEVTARQNAEDVFSVLAEEERRMLADLLAKVRERRADLEDPGAPELVSVGPPGVVNVEPDEVARRTPPEVDLGPQRDEQLRARAALVDPSTLPPYELCIWEYERDGLRAPEHMYTVVDLMRDAKRARERAREHDAVGADDVPAQAREAAEPPDDARRDST